MNAEKIISNLHFSFSEADVQDSLFTRSHVKYKCTISNRSNDERYTFAYQCNPDFTTPEINDCLNCLLMDADGAEYDCADFLMEYGYNDTADALRKGMKAYKACKRTAEALNRLFSAEDLEALREYFAEY